MKKILFLFYLLTGIFFKELLAQNDVAMLSDQCVYLGKKVYLKPGVYRAYELSLGDNRLSSFHLPSGMAIQLFEYDNYQGRTETFYSSILCLSPAWNNQTSSIKIYWINDPGNEGGSHGGNNIPGPDAGNNLPAQGDKVIFYRDIKYSGMSKRVGAGNFGSGILGFLTNNISSIYIPYGHSVKVTDKNGNTQTFNSSMPSLSQNGWDNRISSGFIDMNGGGTTDPDAGNNLPAQGDKVIFYRDIKYSGMSKRVEAGNFGSGILGFLTNNISSIYIPYGHSVKVTDKNGNTQTFNSSMSSLSQNGWDNRISSGFIDMNGGGVTDPDAGNNLPAQGDKVIFYRDIKYSGMSKRVEAGNFGSGILGFLANNISSVYIPYGQFIQVKDRQGIVQTFTSSIANLAQYGWDNKIYSGFIGNNNGGGQGGNNGGNSGTVNLYADANYRGNVTPCGEGRINYIGVGPDNNISSIQVPPGLAVTVYDGQNLTGSYHTFNSSVINLVAYGWNDRISSVYVYRR